jgi:3-mercaptopyruvate sulfurtransferase SseA
MKLCGTPPRPPRAEDGHDDGAQLIDVQGSSFDADIAKLDRATTYVVYCRSGNRSATAATRMRDAGLTVFDGGRWTRWCRGVADRPTGRRTDCMTARRLSSWTIPRATNKV